MTIATYESKQAAINFAAEQLQAANPHLVKNDGNSLVTAAKNIRIELARAFPGVKFSVKSDRFSGGDAIRINWTDGPQTVQVEEIANRYEAGSFDGMTDSYTYRSDRAFTTAFGDAKYVQTNRNYSDKLVASAIRLVNAKFGTSVTVEEWKTGRAWNVRSPEGVDVASHISRALSRRTCALNKAGRQS